ncbi:MAG TPA: hypothetical protein PKE55_06410 [Kiritimatiellia bacterium]|nr:hypothetical protein [Kiritimatiellia bacterium]
MRRRGALPSITDAASRRSALQTGAASISRLAVEFPTLRNAFFGLERGGGGAYLPESALKLSRVAVKQNPVIGPCRFVVREICEGG